MIEFYLTSFYRLMNRVKINFNDYPQTFLN
ncbi:hypothetical protein EZS27_023671 [termite gut metagenome]|uniref:Uncharacterized protein n=1 Tax=termite gut metagenome TaxID=433724 RepID=A0A5J4R028_9ZZZZ